MIFLYRYSLCSDFSSYMEMQTVSFIYMHTTSRNYRNVAVNLISNYQRLSNEQELNNTANGKALQVYFSALILGKASNN